MGLKWVKLDTDWATNPKVTMLVGEGPRGRSAAYAYIADTVDGTFLAFHPTKNLKYLLSWIDEHDSQKALF